MSKHVFKEPTLVFLARVHRLTLRDSELADYERLREELFTQNEHIAICAGALHDVIQATCKATGQTSEQQWKRLGDIADSATSEDHNERSRLRALATVMALWSNEVICHYGWEHESRAFLTALRTCARKHPNFVRDFAPYANFIMVQRHKQSLFDNKVPAIGEHYMRGRIQSPQSPLIMKDVSHLASDRIFAAALGDGNIHDVHHRLTHDCIPCCGSITVGGKTLQELREHHYQACLLGLDRFGLLVPRRYAPGAAPQCTSCRTNDPRLCHPDTTSSSTLTSSSSDVDHSSSYTSPEALSDFTSIAPEDSIMTNVFSETIAGPHHTGNSAFALDPKRFENVSPGQISLCTNDSSQYSPSAHTPWSLVDFEQNQPTILSPVESHADPWPIGLNKLLDAAPCSSDTQESSLEDMIFKKHRASIMLCLERARTAPGFGSSTSNWFQPNIQMARIFADAESHLGVGTASYAAEADVMYCSASRFCELARTGTKFPRPVVIKEAFSDQSLHTMENFVELLTDAYRRKPVSTWLAGRQCIEEVPLELLLEMLVSSRNTSRSIHPSAPQLSLDLPALANAQAPSFTMLNRYRLLQVLAKRGDFFSCHQTEQSPWGPFDGLNFNHFCTKNTFSGPYAASIADVWERTLFGLRICLVVPTSTMDSQAWGEFATQGISWCPNGRERLIILTEEDVLFIPADARVVYAFYTPERCLVESGFVWDSSNIVETLRSMKSVGVHADRGIIRKPLLYHVPEMVAELHEMLREDWARFAGAQPAEVFERLFGEALDGLVLLNNTGQADKLQV